jgi:CIC family chloride channel protein
MAGILSGVLHAPLTAIFLIAEITGGYVLMIPLMIVTAISFFISKYFNKYSVYTTDLARKGIDFRSEKEKFALQHINIESLVETDFDRIHPNMNLRELVEKIQYTRRNLFPVVNDDDKLVGVVTLDDIRSVILDKDQYDVVLIYEIMNSNFQTIEVDADINTAVKIFEEKQVWNIAVTRENKYVGFISKSNLYNRYISLWHQRQSEEI